MQDILTKAASIKMEEFDLDGVLTDGSLYYCDDGQEIKAFHSRDRHGMEMLQDSGVRVGIITGRNSALVARRMQNLGIEHVYQGQQDKLPAYVQLLEDLHLRSEQVAYVGDDVVDLPIMRRVGLAIAVQDAHELVKKHAHWQTPNAGGRGAARDVCELIMEAQGTLEAQMSRYL